MRKQYDVKTWISRDNMGKFPCGTCCAEHCRDCAHIEMENDHYNDGTRRCDYRGEWVHPYDSACPNFTY